MASIERHLLPSIVFRQGQSDGGAPRTQRDQEVEESPYSSWGRHIETIDTVEKTEEGVLFI